MCIVVHRYFFKRKIDEFYMCLEWSQTYTRRECQVIFYEKKKSFNNFVLSFDWNLSDLLMLHKYMLIYSLSVYWFACSQVKIIIAK